jgi:hypothetical protein
MLSINDSIAIVNQIQDELQRYSTNILLQGIINETTLQLKLRERS